MKPTFENSIDVLVKAYLNDTLEHGNCCSCAVGNLVASAMGIKFKGTDWAKNCKYPYPGDTINGFAEGGWGGYVINRHPNPNAIEQIEATGYTVEELAKIESAFELAEIGDNGDDWMYNGLMAVLDVLVDIHGVDLSVKEEAKLMFVKV